MNIGRLTVAILKVVMCTVGCAIAVLLIWSINVHHINKLYFVWVLGGAIFGLCVGMSWVIERKEVRTRLCCADIVWVGDLAGVSFWKPRWSTPGVRLAHEGAGAGVVNWECMGAFTSWGI